MGDYNNNASYGAAFFGGALRYNSTLGRTFVVAISTDANFKMIQETFLPDAEGAPRLFSTITLALAATASGRGDRVLISPNFNTSPTLTELATCATNGVTMEVLGGRMGDSFVAQRAATTLPQTGASPIFVITAPVRILDIVGEVTTSIQAQADCLTLMMAPTVGAGIASTTAFSIGNPCLGVAFNVTGGLTGGILTYSPGAHLSLGGLSFNQSGIGTVLANNIVLPAGNLQLHATAGNTGAIKWIIRYQPLSPGAYIYPF